MSEANDSSVDASLFTHVSYPELTRGQSAEVSRTFTTLARFIAAINTLNGWRDLKVTKGDRIALIHSEASELLEWTRQAGDPPMSDHIEFSGETEELADLIIRVIDYAEIYDLPLAKAVLSKIAFNATRGYRHGGKKL